VLSDAGTLVVVQDDANWLAFVLLDGLRVTAVPLPGDATGKRLFDESRGTKGQKMDLEAAIIVDGQMLAFGSGSSSKRERLAICALSGAAVQVVDAHPLYEMLRGLREFAGSSLNIEGATVLPGLVRLFNRKSGTAHGKDTQSSVNASCDLSLPQLLGFVRGENAAPAPTNVVQYELGDIQHVPLGFTDATTVGGNVFFSGAAEDTANPVLDGPVAGSVIGVLPQDGDGQWIEVTEASGSNFLGKIEGLVVMDDVRSAVAIVDRDDINVPSELVFLHLPVVTREMKAVHCGAQTCAFSLKFSCLRERCGVRGSWSNGRMTTLGMSLATT
jgi:hypothetical protein